MPSIFESVFLLVCHLVAICDWQKLPSIDDAQPLAAVAPKDAAPSAPPPARPAAVPAPVKPVAAPVKPAPIPAKPAPAVKPAPKSSKSTEPTVVRIRPSGTKTIERKRLYEGDKPSDTTLTIHTDDAGKVQSMTVEVEPAILKPHKEGGGHHTPAKRAFEGAPNYNEKKALAIPNAELKRLNVEHPRITGIQRTKYLDFAKTNKVLTWDAIAKLETEVLVKAGMNPATAKATVDKAIQALKEAGVAAPVRIPWSNN